MNFNYYSQRAKRARLIRIFSRGVGLSLRVGMILAAIAGVFSLVGGWSLGWLLLGIGVSLWSIYKWQSEALRTIPTGSGDTLDSILEPQVLAYLPRELTPRHLALAAMRSTSAQFFVVRFGISSGFLNELASESPSETAAVLELADSYRQQVGTAQLTGGMLAAALCVSQPQLKQMLPHLQLDESDMVFGVRWYERLMQLIAEEQKPKRTGGIARDWSFGWANLLSRFGTNLSMYPGNVSASLNSHDNALRFLYDTFAANGRQNAALIGPVGSGKSTLVRSFAESLLSADSDLPANLKFRQVISLDASSIISAAHSRSELEGLVNQLFVEAYKAKNIILCLDDAQLFLEDRPGSVDLSSILMPVLEGGSLRLILTMDEQRYLQISQRNPSLAAVLNRITIAPTTEDETILVMQDQIISIEFQRSVTFMYQALRAGYRLSERYMYELVQPGKSVRLLEQAAGYHEQGLVTANSVARCIEETSGIKVGQARDSSEKEKLLNLEKLIHERMINQTRAVSVVSDALRRARAGVRNESRPIGTFLFLGPTGVGKTELSKALAAVYFGGEDRLVRLDLNEFVRSEDVARLIADGAEDPNSLTAQIMKQPFSVVLLDEIEKAHPQVLTTLLQLLDEGVLRDINNREVSFRDAIVIATSNAGADRIRQLIDAGQQLEQFEEQLTNELIDSQQFRPEFLNRFDEIVVFRPLTQDELGQVVQLIISSVNITLEPQKLSVDLEPAAISKLAAIGYDPRLGARPMRRVVQRSVENLVAKKVLEGSVQPGDVIPITEDDIQLQ